MKLSDRYLKIVEWSEEDGCYAGRCPGLMLGGVHGMDEVTVYQELCEVVEEWIKIYGEDGRPLPHLPPGNSTAAASNCVFRQNYTSDSPFALCVMEIVSTVM